jgi:protease-4
VETKGAWGTQGAKGDAEQREGSKTMIHSDASVNPSARLLRRMAKTRYLPPMSPALLIIALSLGSAFGQDREPDVVLVPTATIATEDGPGSPWVNPANQAYDADPRWGVFASALPGDEERPVGAGAALGIAGVSAGLRWQRRGQAIDDFAIDLSAGVRLPRRLAVGAAVHFNLESGERDHVAFDAAASWRPLPWVGASLVARNIGSPGRRAGSPAETTGGVALRPIGRTLLLGADLRWTFGGPFDGPAGVFSARVRPTEGLYLRAGADTRGQFGAGIELYFGGSGVGVASGATGDLAPWATAWAGSDEPGESVARSRHRVVTLSLVETPRYEPEQRLITRSDPSWLEVLQQFELARTSPDVRGMVLRLGDIELDAGRWTELHDRVVALQAADKPVLVHLATDAPTGALYVASAADRALAHPGAVLRLERPRQETLYFGGLLDALGVHVDVARRSSYKSASEPFTRSGPSPEDVEQRTALLQGAEERLISGIAEGRAQTADRVRAWLDGGPYTAREAAQMGLVDGLAWPDELDEVTRERHGERALLTDPNSRPRGRSPWEPPAQIAVIYALGTLLPGETPRVGARPGGQVTGAVTLAQQLQRAALDPKVRAVVLRVDSPGGATLAAQDISRAIEAVRNAGKPVVASMGDVAASGGYWIAASASSVWASADTITGSIGVITLHPSLPGLGERIGVNPTQIPDDARGSVDSPWHRWDPAVALRMDTIVAETYDTFKAHVAAARQLSPEAVEAVAQGRVWSGREARELGLVDHNGGLLDAVQDARRQAGIPDRRAVEVVGIRPRPRLTDLLLPELSRIRVTGPAARAASVADGLLSPLSPALSWFELATAHPETLWLIEPSQMGHQPR